LHTGTAVRLGGEQGVVQTAGNRHMRAEKWHQGILTRVEILHRSYFSRPLNDTGWKGSLQRPFVVFVATC